jgi:nucleotide-binding universal stress UspA family protein
MRVTAAADGRKFRSASYQYKERAMLPIRTILHPTDFSDYSQCAFRLAASLATDCGARLIVLHVLDRPVLSYPGVMTPPPPPPLSAAERETLREQLRRTMPSSAGVTVEHLLEEGDPATAILQIAQERGCDLIVIGTHGRTGLSRLLMGSVAEQVVRRAACPVLTVKSSPQSASSSAAAGMVAAEQSPGHQ